MEFSYNELFKSIPVNQQQHFSHNVQPEVAAGYLFALQNQNKKKKKRATVSPEEINNNNFASQNLNINDPAVAAELAMKKRRKGADPRKCYNDSCDRIVTKRNYCYKCQKRKERGLALNPKLPSIKQLLLPSDKKRTRKNTSSIPEPLPTVNDINNTIINNHSQPRESSSSHSSPSTFLPFNILPNIKEPSDKLPNYFETVLVNLMKERNDRTPLPASDLSSSSTSLSSSSDLFLNNTEFSAQDKQQLHNLHQYLLQLSSGSEEKASTLLFQYISARNAQSPAPTHPLTPSHSSVDPFSFPSSPSPNFPFGQSQMGFASNQFLPSPYSPYPTQSSNDPFNMFSPHNSHHPVSYSDHNVPVNHNVPINHNQIKFGAQDMFLLPSPHSIRPNLFTTPDHNNTPANPYNLSSINNNPNNRMRFF